MERKQNGEDLDEALRRAWSIECREAHGSLGKIEYIGTQQREDRLYDVYRDEDGRYFFGVRIITPEGVKTEYEAIFGRPEPVRHHHNIKRRKMEHGIKEGIE